MPDPGHEKQGARIWVAFHHDYSEFAIFTDELACLRYAIEHSMEAAGIEIGRGVREQENERWAAVRARLGGADA